MLAPESKTISDIEKVIENKRYWVYKELAEKEILNAARIKRDCVNGQGFLYIGKSYRLLIVDTQDVPLKLINGYFCLRQNAVKAAEKSFVDFLSAKRDEEVCLQSALLSGNAWCKANRCKGAGFENTLGVLF